MTRDDPPDPSAADAAALSELARALPTIDLDPAVAERIARRAHHGPGLARLVEPVLAAAFAASHLAWAIRKLLEALG